MNVSSSAFVNPLLGQNQLSGLYCNESVAKNSLTEIQLPFGKKLTLDEFCSHPLIVSTSEKEEVFRKLREIFFNLENIENYYHFVANLDLIQMKQELNENLEKYAIFSFAAFFEGKINQDELFVINIVLESYREENLGENVKQIRVLTLDKNSAKKYFKDSNFTLFSQSEMLNYKSISQREQQILEYLDGFDNLSKINRTVVEYDLNFDKNLEKNEMSIEQSLANRKFLLSSYKEITSKMGTFVLVSPGNVLNQYKRASACKLPEYNQYNLAFGFNPDESHFLKARSISVPSPLFALPNSHTYEKGPKGLSMYYHDINYHMALESQNPHINKFVKIAKKLKMIAHVLFNENPMWAKACSIVASQLLDKEFHSYRYYTKNEAFVKILFLVVNIEAVLMFKNDLEGDVLMPREYVSWFKEIYAPIIMKKISKLKDEGQIERISAMRIAEINYSSYL